MVPCLGNRLPAGLPPPAGGALPVRAGEVLVQGEDLGAWTMAQRVGWDALTPAQQWMLCPRSRRHSTVGRQIDPQSVRGNQGDQAVRATGHDTL
ncbi:hypothetical protein [Streptomyces mirabilis]|uniref:hypothetical protein n=1 Tax=Streptomyces mirabilis TaxID=68239 RepID=UPI0036B15B3F